MKKRYLISSLLVLAPSSFTAWPTQATPSKHVTTSSQTVNVTATVAPYREVVVNSNRVIKEVISNTRKDIDPVYIREIAGLRIAIQCQSCQKEYDRLKPGLDFSTYGQIYTQE